MDMSKLETGRIVRALKKNRLKALAFSEIAASTLIHVHRDDDTRTYSFHRQRPRSSKHRLCMTRLLWLHPNHTDIR